MKNPLSKIDTHLASEPEETNIGFSSVVKKLFLMLLIILASATLYAQVAVELNSYLKQLNASADPVLVDNAVHLESLIKEKHPGVYIRKAQITSGEANPVCVNVNAGYVDALKTMNQLSGKIELITIRLRSSADLNFILDLPNLIGFQKLKYVYFLFEFNAGIEETQKLFIPKPGITVLYKVSVPS